MIKYIVSLTIILTLSFTACGSGDSRDPISSEQPTNPYLEKIDIPEYDSSNPEHVLITTSNGNYSSNVLNDSSKKHFYIVAGDYSASRMKLTSSGTSSSRRTLTLYDPNDSSSQIHPSKLNILEQANVSLAFDGASYWTVSRISNINDTLEGSFFMMNHSSYNILDKLNIKDYYYGVIIRPFCNNNTVQSCYLDTMSHEGTLSDNVGIAVATAGQNNVITSNTKIINNDIRNANDGIQLVRSSGVSTGSFPGTIIDDNRIWMDGDIYTNGDYSTNGYSQDGEYMIGENAIDIKIGSDDKNNPLIITNNIMYGYQHGDATAGGYQDASYGTAFVAHYDVKNVVYEENIIFNSERAFGIADSGEYSIYSAENWKIKNNIFANINLVNPEDARTFGIFIYKAKNMLFENNIFSNIIPNSKDESYFFRYEDTFGGCTFKNNIALNAQGTSHWYNHDDATKNDGVSIIDIDNNYFYNSPESLEGTNTHIVSNIEDLNLENVTFNTKKIAVSETKTLILK